MSDGTVHNLLTGTDLMRGTFGGIGPSYVIKINTNGGVYKDTDQGLVVTSNRDSKNDGIGLSINAADMGLVKGETYVWQVELAEASISEGSTRIAVWHSDSLAWWIETEPPKSIKFDGIGVFSLPFTYSGSNYVTLISSVGVGGSETITRIGLYHASYAAAWAPAEGEEIAGGASMSANLWDSSTASIKPDADGVYTEGKSGTTKLHSQVGGTVVLAENQTVHMGASLRGADSGSCQPYVEYADTAGNKNWVGFPMWTPTADWQRFDGSCVVPSGMTITALGFNNSRTTGAIEIANPTFSYGTSGPILASDSHTPYATQDHVAAELNGMRDTVAPTEDTGAASRNYAVGEFFYDASHNLCRVTQAVSQGASLVSGTNYTTVSGGVQQYIGTPTYVYATAPSEATVKAAHATPCFVYVVDTASFYYVS